jgi:Flp pilus assembly protein TadG
MHARRNSTSAPRRGIGRALSSLAALRAERSGQALAELALIVPIIAALTLTIADVGMGFYFKTQLMTAAQIGAQYAMNNRDNFTGVWSTTDINNAVINATGLSLQSTDITTALSCRCVDQGSYAYSPSNPTPSTADACKAASRSDCPGMGGPAQKPGAYVTVTVAPACPDRCYRPLFNYLGLGGEYALTASATVRIQ